MSSRFRAWRHPIFIVVCDPSQRHKGMFRSLWGLLWSRASRSDGFQVRRTCKNGRKRRLDGFQEGKRIPATKHVQVLLHPRPRYWALQNLRRYWKPTYVQNFRWKFRAVATQFSWLRRSSWVPLRSIWHYLFDLRYQCSQWNFRWHSERQNLPIVPRTRSELKSRFR